METRSKELFERAKQHIPGGVNSPVRTFQAVGRTPRFIRSARGSRIWDADGNEYIDYVCSWGPGILGHADSRVIQKVKEACDLGLTYGAPTEKEVELAELIAELIPSMEVSRLVSSGTEAVMSAVRAARGYTGKDKIIKFRGCYHGHSDGLLVKAGSGALTTSVPDSAGVPADYTKNTLVAEFNDKDSVETLFQSNPGEIAAVIVEPVAANMGVVLPEEGFLEFLRDITKDKGALLIFDEVITGFRLALGGAQEYFHVTPDLTTLGKIVGGGMPIGAYGGKREIMQMISPDGPVYQAGTLSGNPIATTAGIETLKILKEDPAVYERLETKGEKMVQAVREAAGEHVRVNQIGSLLSVFFTKNRKYDTKYIKEKRGQAGPPVPAVSKKDWRDTDMKNQQAGARIDPLLYHFRIAYIALALLPFVFCFFMLFRIFTSPLPAGYSSVFGYLGALLSLPAILYLAVNLALYEALCALGCALFRRQLQLSKRALALMCAALAAIGFLLHPQVLGMETWLFLINVQTDASPLTLALWGCLQPQVLLAAATLLAGLLCLHFKGPRQAVARLDVKAAAE